MKLVLGVLDVAYADAEGKQTTTGDVAEILEQRYHVMETFLELRKDKIAGFLADSMANAIEVLVKTGGTIDTTGRRSIASHVVAGEKRSVESGQSGTYTYEADQKIETEFRTFLASNELGIMTQAVSGTDLSGAAAAGVSHRRKKPYAKRAARPAFVDTGLYMSSFRAWTEE